MNVKWPLVFLSVVSFAAPCQSQDLGAWTDSYIKGLPTAQHFRGTIVAERNGHVLVEKSYGLAVEEWKVPNSPDTKFEIASVSKQFTAAAILQLVDSGKLQVDDPVSKYYSEAPLSWKDITVHQLLTHASGLPNNRLDDFTKGICSPYTPDELIKTFRDRPLAFTPGSSWAYTNTEYYLLAFIIEKLSGESYGAYLARHIFEPLKMVRSGFATTLAIVPQLAQGYTRENGSLRHRDYFDRSLEIGAGGIYTNAEDLLRWNRALDSPGFLSAHALDLMFTAHPPGNYGYGWFIATSPRRKIYHEGGDPGFAAFEARYPDEHVVIIILANEDDSPVRDIADALAKHLFGD